ncbi:hypothetical protein [Streptomyces sp. NPDC005799]|uniref:hypothetical protein n=1 Tax=Streptomyces sp. NPDC005799 TaxID=3154678 RepID=UPI0033E34F57
MGTGGLIVTAMGARARLGAAGDRFGVPTGPGATGGRFRFGARTGSGAAAGRFGVPTGRGATGGRFGVRTGSVLRVTASASAPARCCGWPLRRPHRARRYGRPLRRPHRLGCCG